MSRPRFFLCNACRSTWTALVAASCCGERPIDCSPWSSDARTWFKLRTADRAEAIYAAAWFSDKRDHRRSLAKGIRARGNTSARLRGGS